MPERRQHRLYWVTVWWRRTHDAHVACSHERELQGAWYRRRRHRERIDIGLQLAQLLLRRHSELLFLVDDEQSEVLPLHLLAYELVGAYENVHLSLLQIGEYLLCLLRTSSP